MFKEINSGTNTIIIHKNNYLKNVFTSLRMPQYSIFTSRVVTSDVISSKMSEYSKIKLECRAQFFLISNTNLNMKMGCKCIKVYYNIFIWALSSLCNKEIRSEKSLRIHFKNILETYSYYSSTIT